MQNTQPTITNLTSEQANTSNDRTEQILAEMLQTQGWIPKPLKIMAKRSGIVERFMAYRNQVFEGGPLSEKERYLVALSAVVALKSANCIPVQAEHARKAGANEDEIIQTMLIAGLVSGTSPLQVAYAGLKEQS